MTTCDMTLSTQVPQFRTWCELVKGWVFRDDWRLFYDLLAPNMAPSSCPRKYLLSYVSELLGIMGLFWGGSPGQICWTSL